MSRVIKSFFQAMKMIKDDKVLLLLSLIPIVIGVGVYVALGSWLYTSFIPSGVEWVQDKVSLEWLGSFLSWIIKGLFFILFGGLANYTFVLAVSLFASPFNDMIVDRLIKKQKGEDPSLELSFKETMKRLPKTLVNELKKISLIVVLSIISLVLSFIPFMAIVSFIIQVILLSVTFLDYYWSRKNLSVGECVSDFRSHFLFNFLSGVMFFCLLLIPGGGALFFPVLLIQYGSSTQS
tara:strand:+ start:1601 stop:2308 length:708 start_codon:yes stop_codon:yes gene_type:complete